MYTTRNCKGLKEACPKHLGTRCTWAVRMGKEKRHPADKAVSITKEWDVDSTKVKWRGLDGDAAGKLKVALECDNQVEVVWDEVGFLCICPQAARGDSTQEGQSSNGGECGNEDQVSFEQSKWVETEDYPWSVEDELGFFGAHREWGVG